MTDFPISDEAVEAAANDYLAAFYALELYEDGDELPVGTMQDWRDLRIMPSIEATPDQFEGHLRQAIQAFLAAEGFEIEGTWLNQYGPIVREKDQPPTHSRLVSPWKPIRPEG